MEEGNMIASAAPLARIDTEALSRAIRARMVERGIGLRPVGAETGLTFATIARMINQTNAPNGDTFVTLCAWLERDPRDFITPPFFVARTVRVGYINSETV